ncbi:DNA/RNA non-specific endonuclease [Shewanella baltica]|uniref:DNA/RNA non-specific endonuclease n=1 Tax=Shewanella baltica TaxID=62322 RepID=UPI00217E78CF|nr:DNA/RNA non-specific endonuclease [Shewanella baltica]
MDISKAGKAEGIKDGLDNDEGGHLIASNFDGPGEQINYAAMDGNLNKGAWKAMENKWAEAIKEKLHCCNTGSIKQDGRQSAGMEMA